MDESEEDYFEEPFIQGYVPVDNVYMSAAKEYARLYSLDKTMPAGSVIVSNKNIIGYGTNGSDYHNSNICERVRLNIPTGQGYELCEGCHPKNHSEVKAIEDALVKGFDLTGSELYLWGHWWLCRWCRDRMAKVKIKTIYLLENSEIHFNKKNVNNIIGNQFKK